MEISGISVGLIAVGSTLLGVIITSIFSLVSTHLTQKSEERKHNRSLVMQIGFDYWKEHVELAKEETRRSGKGAFIPPPEAYIIFMLKLSEELLSTDLNIEEIEKRLRSATEVYDRVIEVTAERDATRRASSATREPRSQ